MRAIKTLDDLQKAVVAAHEVIEQAVMLHATWKTSTDDADLQKRVVNSEAVFSFGVVRWSLRREMLLALMRLWDTNKEAFRVSAIAEALRDEPIFSALVERQAAGVPRYEEGHGAGAKGGVGARQEVLESRGWF